MSPSKYFEAEDPFVLDLVKPPLIALSTTDQSPNLIRL